jgi:hypothetical protein
VLRNRSGSARFARWIPPSASIAVTAGGSIRVPPRQTADAPDLQGISFVEINQLEQHLCSVARGRPERSPPRAPSGETASATANSLRAPSNPRSKCSPRSSNERPDPAARSRVIAVTSTSPSAAVAATRVASWTETPRTSSPRNSISPAWTAARIETPYSGAESTILLAQRTARAAPSKTTRNPSPVVLISRPRDVVTMSRIRALCRASRSFHLLPPRRFACPLESTMSVTTTVARTRSLSDSSGSSQPRTPLHSIETTASLPTTHASWPGATSITLLGPISNSSPCP